MKTRFFFCLLLILCFLQSCFTTDFADTRFDYVWAYYEGVAQFEKDGKIGLLDTSGNILAPVEYDNIDIGSYNNLRKVERDGRMGMLDINGVLWQGKLFHELVWLSKENGFLIFREGEPKVYESHAGMMNTDGEVIYPATWYDYDFLMHESEHLGESIPKWPIYWVIHDDYEGMGVLNTKGEWVVPPMHGKVQFDCYESGRLRMASGTIDTICYGVVDETGIIIEPVWDDIVMPRESDLFPVCKDKKWGFADQTGELVIPLIWTNTYDFIDGYAPVQAEDGRWGFINTIGELVVPTVWAEVDEWSYSNGYANVMEDAGKWGVINMEGSTIVSFLWDDLAYDSQGNTVVKKDGRYGFIYNNESIALPLPYEGLWYITENIYCVLKDGAWGYVFKNGVPLTPFEFEEERWFLLSVAEDALDWLPCVYLDESKGCMYVNLEGKIMLEGIWNDADPFWGRYARVKYNGKYGVIDREGTIVIPIEYSNIYIEEDNLFQVTKDGVDGWIGPDFSIIAGIKE